MVRERPPGTPTVTRSHELICDTGTVMPAPGELTFVAPRGAKKPPRHLADLTPVQRREAVAAIGEKPFRAAQVSRHSFARYTHDPADWTDIPVAAREKLAAELLPDLMSVVRHISCD